MLCYLMSSADFAWQNGTTQSTDSSKGPVVRCLHAYCISTIQIPPEECLLCCSYTVLERPAYIHCWHIVIIYKHSFTVSPWLINSLKTSQLPVCVNLRLASLTLCLNLRLLLWHQSLKLKVNSRYWCLLERPFSCGVSHPVWTWYQTEFLINLLLLRLQRCFFFFYYLSRYQVYSLCPPLFLGWQMSPGPDFSYISVWWESWRPLVGMVI